MNKTQTLLIDDPFRAAYLLRFGKYKETRLKNKQRYYVIEGNGQTLAEENYRYRTGYAMVNPLALRESFYLLKELVNEEPFEVMEDSEDSEDEWQELDLLADNEE